jgi:DNA-binding NtrC family response regulator
MDARVVRPLGSLETRAVDVRFLASSSASPGVAVADGRLRQDLYHRLRALEIEVPPLRARRDDIPLLARHFLEHHGRRLERAPPVLAGEAMEALRRHDWPGNVRELEAVAVRLLIDSSPRAAVGAEAVRRLLTPRPEASLFPDALFAGRGLDELRRELERAYLVRLFHAAGGDNGEMTASLGIKRSNLYTWLRKLGIDIAELRRRLGLTPGCSERGCPASGRGRGRGRGARCPARPGRAC